MVVLDDKDAVVKQLIEIISQHVAKGEYQRALDLATQTYSLAPNNSKVVSYLMVSNLYLTNYVEAIKYALLALSFDKESISAYDTLAHAFGGLRDWKQSGFYGKQALELRNKDSEKANPVLPNLPAKPDLTGKKNIVSFSLFGSQSAYVEPAVMNVQVIKEVYPGWRCRFYVDESVPESVVKRLSINDTEIIHVTEEMKKLPGTMWRFLAMDDPEVGYVIFRDADSVISQREATTVAEWIASGQRFHTIRDSGSHTELILAGLWGAMAGSIPNFTSLMYSYAETQVLDKRFADQFFLRDFIWPYVKQDLYASDRVFGFWNAHPITSVGENFEITHIGCDEGATQFSTGQLGLPEGTPMIWRLYTPVLPLPEADLTPRYASEERLVCEYQTTVQNGRVSGHIPRRYGAGLDIGRGRITVEEIK